MSELNLYVLEMDDRYQDYDMAQGYVIRAPSPEHARRIARRNDRGNADWEDPERATCREFIRPGRVGVILKAIRYG